SGREVYAAAGAEPAAVAQIAGGGKGGENEEPPDLQGVVGDAGESLRCIQVHSQNENQKREQDAASIGHGFAPPGPRLNPGTQEYVLHGPADQLESGVSRTASSMQRPPRS